MSIEPQEGTCSCQGPEVRTSDLQTWERMNLCCFKPLVCGVLLRRPREAHLFTYAGKSGACKGPGNAPQVLEGTETARHRAGRQVPGPGHRAAVRGPPGLACRRRCPGRKEGAQACLLLSQHLGFRRPRWRSLSPSSQGEARLAAGQGVTLSIQEICGAGGKVRPGVLICN